MSLIPFQALPPESRLFIFSADQQLSSDQLATAIPTIEAFLGQWTVHKEDPIVGYQIRYGQFLLVGVDESKLPPSGCSIDALTRFMKELENKVEVGWLDGPEVLYRNAEGIQGTSRQQFATLAARGEVDAGTVVFNNSIQRLGELAENWEIAASDSWHGRAFTLKEATAEQAA
ncbi:MAG: hypothetical protein IT211_07795 [Armatimonadetes bacterium]|nr:hypothetical protein [Armatimonadota bacterium]